MNKINFYNNIKYLRINKYKMSMNDFSKFLGINVSNISRWESKKNGITIDMVFDIARKLKISMSDLIIKDLSLESNIKEIEFDKEEISSEQFANEVLPLIDKVSNLSVKEKEKLKNDVSYICEDK